MAFAGRSWLVAAPAPTNDPIRLQLKVPMRDGIQLGTDVWLPSTNGAYPVVFLRFPYNKELGSGLAREGTARGYAVVSQDTRGRFASEGENLPFHLDAPDGEDSAAWIARQSWCNGRIGFWGGSAGAITGYQLGLNGTGPLDAQFLIVGAPSIHEVAYFGGVFRKSLVEDWIRATKFASNALSIWESHSTYDAYWRVRDATRHYRRVRTPAVHVGGYWDIFAQSTIDAFNGYQTQGGPGARGQQKLLLGPWAHGVLQEKVGDLTFRDGKNPPGKPQDHWRWFGHWLKSEQNGVDALPAVTYYVVGDTSDAQAPGNLWRTAATWPPFQQEPVRYYLHPDRSLRPTIPAGHDWLSYTYQPTHPAPTIGGIQLTLLPAGPRDQRPLEDRADVLVFTSATLEQPTEVTGRIRARLWISSDCPDTDFFVRLCDVYPDGRSFNLCEGMLRTRFRAGLDREHFLKPGVVEPIDIDCWSTSVIFNRGHRIRVHVTSSSAPGFDPNPNTGEPLRSSSRSRPARNAVHMSPDYPSHVLLPIISL